MVKKGFTTHMAGWMLIILGIISCKTSPEITSLAVRVRLPNEPESLHPIFSKSLYAAQIESLILLPLAEFDPVSLELSPLLLSEMPVGEKVLEGKHAGGKVFRLRFRPEAVWSDGKPVTGEDYLFTFKSVYNPHVNAASWKAFMDYISEIEIDPADPKKVTVYMDSSYILDLGAVTNFNIYPAHQYDPDQIMMGFTLEELRAPNPTWTAEQDTLLKKFATRFESPEFFRETVTGCGAYALDTWVTGEYIRLTRKENWWGDNLKDAPLLLQAYPSEITYRIILDAAAAEAALKAGEIDVMAEVPVSTFKNLSTDDAWKDKLQFATPALMQVNYLELNTRDSILHDIRVRRALAHTIDYNGILNNIMQGYADRAVGPIHPSKSYYNATLKPVEHDLNQAMSLLKEAGWTDTNGNGTPDKLISGKREELELSLKVVNREEGIAIANIVKENAAKAGFEITIEIVESSQLQQDVRQRNFEIFPLRVSAFPGLDDPGQLYHSDSDRPGGSNRSGIHSDALDEMIDDLQATEDPVKRDQYYKAIQEIIYQEQPSIFLYVPKERIIASKKIKLMTSSRRPGYFENLIQPAGS